MDVFPRLQAIISCGFVIFGLFRISASTLVWGITESFITHFITHLVDEAEWDGDRDVVVREIKSPFSVLGRDHGDSPAGFLADVQLQEYFG